MARGRGSGSAGSTGLGLDIVRRLAESTGGDVRIGSSMLGGTEVRIWIQLDGREPERNGHRGAVRRRRRGKLVSTFNRSRSLP
jgi:light-regulated signal transduction histidine kinase (bacteriophytochrome)